MNKLQLVLFALTLGLLFLMSCNDPSSIGADLLVQDQANTKYTDTLTLLAQTVKEDSVLVYDPNPAVEFNNFLIADLEDPVFGNVKAGIFGQLWLGFDPPDFEDATMDSIVLTLRYDSLNVYGDVVSEPVGIGVYRLKDNIPLNEDFYNTQTFDFDEMNPLFEDLNFIPRLTPQDSIPNILTYNSLGAVDTLTLAPHLRMHMPVEFGQELFAEFDSTVYSSFSNFLERFNGVHIKALNPSKGVVSFDLVDGISGLTIYYEQDSLKKQYRYSFSSSGVRFTNFTHDFGGSTVDAFFDDANKGDSLLFIQSLAGPNVRIDIPYAEKLDNLIVNKAELHFTVAVLEEDEEDIFNPLERMLIVRKVSDQDPFIFIQDVVIGGSAFGGRLKETEVGGGNILNTYSLNISSYFQDIVDGTRDETIYLRAFPKQENARRAVLFGPGHSTYPAKLILTYTQLNP